MSNKSPDAFRTISEVAEWLGVPTHVLRFWESRFSQVKPVKRAGGRRYYRPADMELLGGIRKLLHEDGMTIRGVQKLLREQGVKHIAAMSPSIDSDELRDVTPSNVVSLEAAKPSEAPVLQPSESNVEDAEIVAPKADTDTGAENTEEPNVESEPPLAPIPDPEPITEPVPGAITEPEPEVPPLADESDEIIPGDTTEISTAEPEMTEIDPLDMAAALPLDEPEGEQLAPFVLEAGPIDPPAAESLDETAPQETVAAPPPTTEPAQPAMLDISHIPDDPPEDDENTSGVTNVLLTNLRAARTGHSIQNSDEIADVSSRLGALKSRMNRERQREKQL